MQQASGVLGLSAPHQCSYCSRTGRVRCSVCKTWYCTAQCQANHWPVHTRECVPVPELEWPDGSRYDGQLEDVADRPGLPGQLQLEHQVTQVENEMKEDGRGDAARIENSTVTATSSSQKSGTPKDNIAPKLEEKQTVVKVTTVNKQESAVNVKKVFPPKLPASSSPNPVLPASTVPSKQLIPSPTSSASPPTKQTAVAVTPPTAKKEAVLVPAVIPVKPAVVPVKPAVVPVKPAVVPAKPGVVPVKPAVSHSDQLPSPVPVVSSAFSLPPTTKTISPTSSYIPAYQSSTLPPQVPPPPGKLSQIVLPVEDLTSPGNFCVRLASDDASLMKLLEVMNETPPPTVPGWVVGRRETLAVYFEDIWYRGLAIKKTEGMFSVYLLDFGGALVTVAPDQLRPLPNSLSCSPAVMYQVCLAGLQPVEGEMWGEEVGQLMGEIVNSDMEYKLGVEFLGQVDGGRWLLKMRGIEDDEDIGQMLLEGELAKSKEDMMDTSTASSKDKKQVHATSVTKQISSPSPVSITTPSSTQVQTATMQPKVVSNTSSQQSSKLIVPTEPEKPTPAKLKIPRGVLPANTITIAGVCFLETPDKFYVCPSSCIDQFMSILSSAQATSPGVVNPLVGSSCLAMDEDCWYRAEVVKLNRLDKPTATLFLLDYGKTVIAPVSALRPLPSDLASIPGLVCLVTLRGVKPGDKMWSADEIAGALLVMDVGGETQFKVKDVEVDKEWRTMVSMEDMEGNDVADLMVETGIAEKDDQVTGDIKLITGTLESGQQQLLVLSALSPMEINLCSQAQFLKFSDTIVPMVEEAASHADTVSSPKEGDIVLACEDQVWYRATVMQLLPAGNIKVYLVDLAIITTLPMDKLRSASAAVVKEPVVAVSCCLDTWVGEDKKMAVEKWGDKMEGMLEQYGEVKVDVMDTVADQVKVKIPHLEQKLGKKEMSRAEMLKMKLKSKK